MTRPNSIAQDCIVPDDAIVEVGVSIGERVVLAGSRITIRERAKIEAAAVIGEGVTIGQGAGVRPGAVVLRSIPANSIVEGNPAQVVGYARSSVREEADAPRHVDINSFSDIPRPGRISLGVDDSALYLMRRVTDARGALTVGEVPSEVPFAPARYFAVFDVPSVELRGEHAHKQCQQFLICLNGTCRVLLDNGEERCEVTLDRPEMGVFMPNMIWGTQYRYSRDAVLLVFASHTYDPDDYIRDYDEFILERKRLLK